MKILTSFVITLITLTFTGISVAQQTSCDAAPGVPGSDVSLSMFWDNEVRTYTLHLPTNYDCQTPLPIVLGVHGSYGSGGDFENNTAGMFDHLNENNYIGIFPDGMTMDGDSLTSFNDLGSRNDYGPDGATCNSNAFSYGAYSNCGANETVRACQWGTSCADDAGFFHALLDHVIANYSVDTQRIYMMGFSQGGQTVSGLTCSLQDRLAAVVPVNGFSANGFTCAPTSKVSIMQIWGTRDKTVRGDGIAGSDGFIYDGASEAATEWADAQQCDPDGSTAYSTVSDGKKNWQCTQHASCASGAEVVTCSWAGGHSWANTRKDGNFGLDAIWDFLKDKSK